MATALNALADPEASTESLRAACEEALQLGAQQVQLIDALLTLATSEGGVERWEPCDLGQIAETVIVGRREARRRDIREWLDGRLAERGLKNPLDGELSWRVLDYRGETSSRRSTA